MDLVFFPKSSPVGHGIDGLVLESFQSHVLYFAQPLRRHTNTIITFRRPRLTLSFLRNLYLKNALNTYYICPTEDIYSIQN